ncbi:MAG: helix-turn-helix transcriptional regulator [Acidovorax sp.]|nr:helix-turn-helix transcriptional regulator [Acidovorax sp.]
MQIQSHNLATLAERLAAERKRQGLSRSQAAAVCNVSTSFIRDAESVPERCSLGKLLQLVQGLGLVLEVNGWPREPQKSATAVHTDAVQRPFQKDTTP